MPRKNSPNNEVTSNKENKAMKTKTLLKSSNKQYPILLFPLLLVYFEIITYLSNDMYLPSLPALTKDLNISQDLSQYTLSLWFLGSASMQLFMGPLSDRYGRKIVLLGGGIAFIIASFVCALTSDINWMLAGRFIQGATVCAVVVAGYAAIHEAFDSKTAIKIIALMGSITVLAPALGPLLGAVILEFAHWRAIFHFLGVTALIGAIALWRVMPETRSHVVHINIRKTLLDYFKISTRRTFLSYMLPFCLLFLSLICWIVESPFIVIETYQKTPLDYGVIQLLVFGSFIIGAQATRILIHREEAIKIIQYGTIIASISACILLLCIMITNTELYYIVGCMMLLGFGASMAFGPLNRAAIDSGTEPMGRRVAVFSAFMSAFGLLGTVLVTWFNNKTMAHLSILIASGTILACILFYLLHRRK